jgi:hypothetical protein
MQGHPEYFFFAYNVVDFTDAVSKSQAIQLGEAHPMPFWHIPRSWYDEQMGEV